MSSRDLRDAVPVLQAAVPLIIADYKMMFPNRSLICISVARTAVEQFELFKVGRVIKVINGVWQVVYENPGEIITKMDGYRKKSKHITDEKTPFARAVDFGVIINGKYLGGYKDIKLYEPIRDLAHKQGLIHGSDFPGKFKDWPHVETQGPYYLPKPVVAGAKG